MSDCIYRVARLNFALCTPNVTSVSSTQPSAPTPTVQVRQPKLWTVWEDYYATGEGRTLMARIAYAESPQEALAGFGRDFDPYFAEGAEVLEGVRENEVTRALFAPAAFEQARLMEGRASIELSARFHFNFA